MNISQKREVTSSPTMKAPSAKKAAQFLENVKSEFFKIQWTEDQDVKVYAKIVLISTFLLGMGIYLADVLIQKALFVVDVLFKLLFG
ncbi:MAG: secE [Chlamydiia bacterium]|nr:secE [Chlamydiia bacterium]